MRRSALPATAQVSGSCQGDNPDSMIHQEVLLPGLLLQAFLREKLQELLQKLKGIVMDDVKANGSFREDQMSKFVQSAVNASDIGKRFEYFLATGNLVSRSGLTQSQTSGFTVVAEKLNFLRYISHFRSVHRGAYFAELRTTTARTPSLCEPVSHPRCRRRARSSRLMLIAGSQAAARVMGLHVPRAHA